MTAPAADQSHSEQKKMTVSERNVGALARALEDWLAGRSAGPGRPTVTGARMPDTNGLFSTSVLFEACWADQGSEGGGAGGRRCASRSEERRVGKECRARSAPQQ